VEENVEMNLPASVGQGQQKRRDEACSSRQLIFSRFLVCNADVIANVKFILIKDTETHSFA
jgi:hypothetical protein